MAGLYKLWECVVYAYNDALGKLKAYFSLQTAILQYLEETWMPVVE